MLVAWVSVNADSRRREPTTTRDRVDVQVHRGRSLSADGDYTELGSGRVKDLERSREASARTVPHRGRSAGEIDDLRRTVFVSEG